MKWFNECYGVYLFGIYLLLNVLDWLTGWYKARVKKEASSKAGLNGIIKKVGYWIILLIAFLIPYMFQRLGKDLLDMDLGYLSALGWFTLANLLINETRRILENLTNRYRASVGKDCGFLLLHSTGSKTHGSEVDVPIVYADYYYLEALLRKAKLEKEGTALL